jgi:very-short-patch-repair endonuclease
MADPILSNPIVQEHVGHATQYIAQSASAFYRGWTLPRSARHGELAHVQSPLEALFIVWWLAQCAVDPSISEDLRVVPQKNVEINGERFRLDFAIEPTREELATAKAWNPIAVELDGHGFHERTPEQVRRRDMRDRALMQSGWQVLHFSFSEFTSEPSRCVREVVSVACTAVAMAIFELDEKAES